VGRSGQILKRGHFPLEFTFLTRLICCSASGNAVIMSFGWAPPEELINQGGGKKLNFFLRLEADKHGISRFSGFALPKAHVQTMITEYKSLRRRI